MNVTLEPHVLTNKIKKLLDNETIDDVGTALLTLLTWFIVDLSENNLETAYLGVTEFSKDLKESVNTQIQMNLSTNSTKQ